MHRQDARFVSLHSKLDDEKTALSKLAFITFFQRKETRFSCFALQCIKQTTINIHFTSTHFPTYL